MKRFLKTVLVVGIVFGVLIGAGAIAFRMMQTGLDALVAMEIEDVDLATVPDGTYEGSFSQLPISVIVHVTVLDHVITTIEIVEHVTGQGQSGEAVTIAVIAENSLAVDAIAGATYSSKAILVAVRDALVTQKPAS